MKQKTIIQFILFFALAVFMLWFATKDIKANEIIEPLKASNKWYIFSICAVGVFSIVLRALRWQILIEPLGKKPSFINTFLSTFIGYGVNFFTPRLGEVARCGVLSKYEGIPADKLAGTMIAERLFDLICLVILLIITLLSEYTVVMDYFLTLIKDKLGPNGLYIIFSIFLIGIIAVIIGVKYMLKVKGDNKFGLLIKNLGEGIISVFKMKNRISFVVQTLAIWICYWAMTYLGFLALKETTNLNFGAGLSVLSFGSLGFLFPFGGAGAYQLVVSQVLNKLYLIPETPSLVYGIVSWALQQGILLVGAFIAFIAFPIVNKSKSESTIKPEIPH